ncbi:MAG: hypothetical protein JSW58_07300 [Candidatus Latescibacterota bacterium]|nr:MAG: hypothetical protein JSW58_07300 [Candidatus Latescibacterota bacterium]
MHFGVAKKALALSMAIMMTVTVFFPSRVVTVGGELDIRTIDQVQYVDPQFDVPFPDDVVNFHVPPDVDIEEMDW